MADIEKLIQALNFGMNDACFGRYCNECEYWKDDGTCEYHVSKVMGDALSVIKEQQAEIERLKEENRKQYRKWLMEGR